jgi:hypothetical protein
LGIAYANGPFYNKPWDWYGELERGPAIKICHDVFQKANQLRFDNTPLEQQLILALSQNFPADPLATIEILQQAEQSFAFNMRDVLKSSQNHLDIICLTTEALMNLNRWQLWDIRSGTHTPRCIESCGSVLGHLNSNPPKSTDAKILSGD